jgi:large subunit ribosomal protein L35
MAISQQRTDNRELRTVFMPKLKSHKGASKRFKKTATGKVKRHHSHLRHQLTSKGQKRKDKLAKAVLVSDADRPKVLRMIPYQ